MKQFQAGYIADRILDVFERKTPRRSAFKELSKWCSYFTLESKSRFEDHDTMHHPNVAVVINLLQRGAPTLLNKHALDFLINNCSLIKFDEENEHAIEVKYNDLDSVSIDLVFKSLHLIDPRLDLTLQKKNYKHSWENLGSSYEENFIYDALPTALGKKGAAYAQLFTSQRSIASIAENISDFGVFEKRVRTNFEQQRTDFSVQFPYAENGKNKGIVIEIDGQQHSESQQQYLDTERDRLVVESGWHNTLRVKTSEFNNDQLIDKIIHILVPALDNEYVKTCVDNYEHPIWETAHGLEILQLCLIPFAVARLQRAILEAISHGRLDIEAQNWSIAVIERDVPCAQLAISDLVKLSEVLGTLCETPLLFPAIELTVFSSKEFISSKFQSADSQLINKFNTSEQFDLLIDVAVLERFVYSSVISSAASEIITIRSVPYIDKKRKTITSDLIKYRPFCAHDSEKGLWIENDSRIKESLEYLLQSWFRKKKFREGQLPILHNALQCKSVIGLLPTGGGKSLTYQISALLQPGVCLVIDPIRSLMKDQVDGLKRSLIDSCLLINSTLTGEEKRKAMRKLAMGEVQFVFISPERLQMEEFRSILHEMLNDKVYFSYCVIDEVHCVSEWGHDFRTAYLRLGENAIKYCRTKNMEHIPLFGLTATASYDVLADVQRELSGNDERRRLTEESIIRSEYSKRDELQYIIEEVTFPTAAINNIWDLKRELGEKKQTRVKRLLKEIPVTIDEYQSNPLSIFNETDWNLNDKGEQEIFKKIQIRDYESDKFYSTNRNAGLIFCPHAKGIFGVTNRFKKLESGKSVASEGYFDILSSYPDVNPGFFMGSGSDSDNINKVIQEESFENQDRFINNELNMMVATKAFGMGIDKENIRYTIHINYPGSIESYVQEAGRAGRDRKIALSYILFNDQKVLLPLENEDVEHDLDINMYFHKNSFKGVEKEFAVLDELLTEIHFPDRTFELENLINRSFDINIKCKFWEGGRNKRLYVDRNFSEPLGYLDLITLSGIPAKTVDPNESLRIFRLLKEYIQNQNLNEPVYLWLLRSDKQIGIERILESLKHGESYSITIGWHNNAKERVKTITAWLQKVVHQSFGEETVQQMREKCNEAEAFIEAVCDKYLRFTKGIELDFEEKCKHRDNFKMVPLGTTLKTFMAYFNGYRDKMDTEKAIYRLSILGIIDDYTVNFSSQTFTIIGRKKTDDEYLNNLKNYLLKYYSEKTTQSKLRNIDSIDEANRLRKLLYFLVRFVYSEIQKKRQFAIHDMKDACRLGLERGSVELKDYIDLYFNSKYARTGYSYTTEQGETKNASLTDLTENGKNDDLLWVWLFMEIVDEDPTSNQIDNIKHLRGACARMLNNQPDSYTLLLLSAFTVYMLEYRNPRYLQEAQELMEKAFFSITEKEERWSDEQLKGAYTKFTEKLTEKNPNLISTMLLHEFYFEYENIMIKPLLQLSQMANITLKNLNKVLN